MQCTTKKSSTVMASSGSTRDGGNTVHEDPTDIFKRLLVRKKEYLQQVNEIQQLQKQLDDTTTRYINDCQEASTKNVVDLIIAFQKTPASSFDNGEDLDEDETRRNVTDTIPNDVKEAKHYLSIEEEVAALRVVNKDKDNTIAMLNKIVEKQASKLQLFEARINDSEIMNKGREDEEVIEEDDSSEITYETVEEDSCSGPTTSNVYYQPDTSSGKQHDNSVLECMLEVSLDEIQQLRREIEILKSGTNTQDEEHDQKRKQKFETADVDNAISSPASAKTDATQSTTSTTTNGLDDVVKDNDQITEDNEKRHNSNENSCLNASDGMMLGILDFRSTCKSLSVASKKESKTSKPAEDPLRFEPTRSHKLGRRLVLEEPTGELLLAEELIRQMSFTASFL